MATQTTPRFRPAHILRWTSRILSILSLVFVLLMFLGEALFPHASLSAFTLRDFVALLFFPLGVCLGLLLAWRRELAGGLLTVGSLIAFYLTLFAFDSRFPRGPFFLLVGLPGFFFLAAWALSRRTRTPQA